MDAVRQDIRQALQSLRRSRGFTASAILTMALGIGVNTSVFSILHATLLSPLPYPTPDRLTFIWKDLTDTGYARAPLSAPEIVDLRRGASLHDQIGAIWATTGTLVEDNRPEPLRLGKVTANFLSVLGVPPIRGRAFNADDEQSGGPAPIIISGGLWQSRFGGSDVIGRRLRIDGGWGMESGTYTIVGVMPAGFEMLLPTDASVPRNVDAWTPLQFDLATGSRGTSYLRTIGRIAPDAKLTEAERQIDTVGREIVRRYPRPPRRFEAEPLHGGLVRDARPVLLTLQGAVAFVLLMTCANVASLLVVRSHRRKREIGIRAALGASRGQLTRLLLTESLLLAVGGGVVGVALAYLGLRLLPLLDVSILPRPNAITLSAPVLAFSALASLASGLLFGLAPLVESRRVDLTGTLKAVGGSGSTPRLPTRSLLVLAEVALSVVLLVGAGLLIRTFLNLHAVDPGFRSDRVLTFQLSLPQERYDRGALSRFTRELERELRGISGVEAAGAINQLPLDDVPNWSTPYFTSTPDDQGADAEADARLTTPGYFETVGARLVTGRWITAQDDENQSLVLVVDDRLARKAWPNQSAIDQQLGIRVWADGRFVVKWGRVVGVVRHIRHHRLSEEVREQVFVPFAQAPRNQMGVVVRTAVAPQQLIRTVTRQVRQIDPDLVPSRVQPLDQYVARSRSQARFSMILAAVFAGLSLLLACVGLYSVISYSVAQRTAELGVRAALGASRNDLLALVLRQGLVLTALGLVVGLVGSAMTVRWLKSLLFGVAAFDAVTFVGVPLVLGLTALAACYVPARRAARVDAAEALRIE